MTTTWLSRAARSARWARNRIRNLSGPPKLVLLYHRVAELTEDRSQLAVSPANFRQHMAYLSAEFAVERFEDCADRWDETTVVVTFDDGYADNCLEALPILEAADVPATFFIATGTIGTEREFWWDELERCLVEGTFDPGEFALQGVPVDVRSSAAMNASYQRLFAWLQASDSVDIEQTLTQLRERGKLSASGRTTHRPLSAEELGKLARSPVTTIGAHTVSHACLSALSADQQRAEISRSVDDLKRLTGEEVSVFSYPFGNHVHYNATSVDICRELEFRMVAANNNRAYRAMHSSLEVPRLLARNWDIETFKRYLHLYRECF